MCPMNGKPVCSSPFASFYIYDYITGLLHMISRLDWIGLILLLRLFIFLGLGLHFHPWASLWAKAHTTSNSTRTPYFHIVRSFSNNYSKQRSCGIQYRIRIICTYIPFFLLSFVFVTICCPFFSLSLVLF